MVHAEDTVFVDRAVAHFPAQVRLPFAHLEKGAAVISYRSLELNRIAGTGKAGLLDIGIYAHSGLGAKIAVAAAHIPGIRNNLVLPGLEVYVVKAVDDGIAAAGVDIGNESIAPVHIHIGQAVELGLIEIGAYAEGFALANEFEAEGRIGCAQQVQQIAFPNGIVTDIVAGAELQLAGIDPRFESVAGLEDESGRLPTFALCIRIHKGSGVHLPRIRVEAIPFHQRNGNLTVGRIETQKINPSVCTKQWRLNHRANVHGVCAFDSDFKNSTVATTGC